NRQIRMTDPLGHFVTFTYNAVGLLTSTTDRLGRRRDFLFDADNRMTGQVWYDSGASVVDRLTFSYDANGNELTAANGNGAWTMSYDALNRVTVAKDMWGDTLTFTYDAVGNRTKVEDSKGGTTTSVYDAANNLVSRLYDGSGTTTALRVDLGYDADNQLS